MTVRMAKLSMTLVLFTVVLRGTDGHARMISPLSRSSLWRRSFPSKINIADADLNCGGLIVQYEKNQGKCGECGDDYSLPQPRPNENGGTYGKGMISRAYRKHSIIKVIIEISGSHEGTFEFDVCPLKRNGQVETNECFYEHPLKLVDGSYKFNVTRTTKQLREIVVSLRLPRRLQCRHCVLRWKFHSVDVYIGRNGVTWQTESQRATWINCADIAILKAKSVSIPPETGHF